MTTETRAYWSKQVKRWAAAGLADPNTKGAAVLEIERSYGKVAKKFGVTAEEVCHYVTLVKRLPADLVVLVENERKPASDSIAQPPRSSANRSSRGAARSAHGICQFGLSHDWLDSLRRGLQQQLGVDFEGDIGAWPGGRAEFLQ